MLPSSLRNYYNNLISIQSITFDLWWNCEVWQWIVHYDNLKYNTMILVRLMIIWYLWDGNRWAGWNLWSPELDSINTFLALYLSRPVVGLGLVTPNPSTIDMGWIGFRNGYIFQDLNLSPKKQQTSSTTTCNFVL